MKEMTTSDLSPSKSMKCDLHIHSQYSDGKLSISEIVDLYGRQEFGAIAITDHLCESTNIIGRLSHSLNYSLSKETFPSYMDTLLKEAERAWKQYEMILVPGYEITKNSFVNHRSAHILVLGILQFIDPELPVVEILNLAKNLGALTVAAHPFHTGALEFQTFHLWSQREQLKNLIDAWEINCRRKISKDVLNSGLPLIANSDFHHKEHFASWKTKIHCERSQRSLFESIRQQKIDFSLDRQMC